MSAILLPTYLTAALLLGGAGLAKLRRPGTVAAALSVPPSAVRAASLVELAVAVLMVARPALGGPAGCALYLGFAALVLAQLRRGATRSCGCLGSAELPPSRLHVVANVALACCSLARPEVAATITTAAVGAAAAATAWAIAAGLELLPAAFTAYQRPAE
jgi:hypothetical protein